MTAPSLAQLSLPVLLEQFCEAYKSYKESALDLYQSKDKSIALFKDLCEQNMNFCRSDEEYGLKSIYHKMPMCTIIMCDLETRGEVERKIDSLIKSYLYPNDRRFEASSFGFIFLIPRSCSLSLRSFCLKKDTLPLSFRENVANLKELSSSARQNKPNTQVETDTVSPSEFLQSLRFVSSPEQRNVLALQFVEKIQSMSGKKRQKLRKKFFLNCKRQLQAVIRGTDKQGLDLANGMIFYGGRKSRATKYSLIYSIQYFLDLCIIDAIRQSRHWPKEYASFVKQMPRTVPDIIEYLFLERVFSKLNKQEVVDLKKAYSLGLHYFQIAQQRFITSESSVQFSVPDKNELQKAYTNTLRILSKK